MKKRIADIEYLSIDLLPKNDNEEENDEEENDDEDDDDNHMIEREEEFDFKKFIMR